MQGFEKTQAVREAWGERLSLRESLGQLEEPLRRTGRELGSRLGQGAQEESGGEVVSGQSLGEQVFGEEAGLRAPALSAGDGAGREVGGRLSGRVAEDLRALCQGKGLEPGRIVEKRMHRLWRG